MLSLVCSVRLASAIAAMPAWIAFDHAEALWIVSRATIMVINFFILLVKN
jgi:hypothetical protein